MTMDPYQEEEPESSGLLPRNRNILGATILGLFLVVYLLTLCTTPSPGVSAATALAHSSAGQLQSYNQPLYSILAKGCVWLLPSRPYLSLGLLGLLLGLASLWMFFQLLAGVRHEKSAEEKVSRFNHATAQGVSAIVGTLCLAFCVPFWFISTRPQGLSMQVFLILAVVSLLSAYDRTKKRSILYGFGVVAGLFLAESPTAVLLLPCLAAYALLLMWSVGHLRVKELATVLGSGVLGLQVFPLSAFLFMRTPTFAYRQMEGFGDVLYRMVQDHYISCIHVIPRAHWLLIGCFTILPWLVVVVLPKRGPIQEKSFLGSYFLHAVVTAVLLLVLSNQVGSPWNAFGVHPLIVTPYLMVAATFGYLAGYWYIMLARVVRYESAGTASARKTMLWAYLVVLPVLLLAAAVLNFGYVDQRQARPAYHLATKVVKELGEREWILTSGGLDSELRLAALEQGKALNVLNLSHGQHPVYLRAIADAFESPRLRSLAMVGLPAALGEWFKTDPAIENQLATFSMPDSWRSEGYEPIPMFGGDRGVRSPESVDASDLWRRHQVFFAEMDTLLKARDVEKDPFRGLNQWIQRSMGKTANNLGVFLEERGLPDIALEAYEQALQMDEDNISALLNRYLLATTHEIEGMKEIVEEFEVFVNSTASKYRLWSLSYHYGYVRHPAAFLQRGWSWAMSGRPATAIEDVQQAMALSGQESAGLQLALASLYFQQGDDEASEAVYFSLLEEDGENVKALQGLARLAMRRGKYDEARSYLTKLLDLNFPAKVVLLEMASLEILIGNFDAAKPLVEKAIQQDPLYGRALCTGMLLAVELGDTKFRESCAERLAEIEVLSPAEQLTLIFLQLREKNYDVAEQGLHKVLRMQPNNVQAHELLLKLEIRGGKLEEAEKRVHRMLMLDTGHVLANLILGSIHYSRGELDAAEAAFRSSIETQPTAEALNSLAWIRVMREDYDDAIETVREALDLNKLDGSAWDTLGVAWMHKGKYEQAERALQKAAELKQGKPRILFHLADLYARIGNKEEALRILKDLDTISDKLSARLGQDIGALKARLRRQ